MRKEEFEQHLRAGRLDLKTATIEVGELSKWPYTIGIYERDGLHYVYEIGERQNFALNKKFDNEEEAYEYLYKLILFEQKLENE